MGVEVVRQVLGRGYRVLCCSVSKRHVHFLAELPVNPKEAKRIVGLAKGASSRAVTDIIPGNLWAEGGKYDLVKNPDHHTNSFEYILYEQGASAFTWSFKDVQLSFISGRKRPRGHRKTRARVV